MWLIPDGLILADDHTVAAWAQQRLLPLERGTGYRVANLVPQEFEAFARIFHPRLPLLLRPTRKGTCTVV